MCYGFYWIYDAAFERHGGVVGFLLPSDTRSFVFPLLAGYVAVCASYIHVLQSLNNSFSHVSPALTGCAGFTLGCSERKRSLTIEIAWEMYNPPSNIILVPVSVYIKRPEPPARVHKQSTVSMSSYRACSAPRES